jgi:hypothetical protein
VPVQEKRRRLSSPAQTRDEVRPLRIANDQRLDPARAEQVGYVLDAGPLVAGRVRSVEPDQLAKKLNRVRRFGLRTCGKHWLKIPGIAGMAVESLPSLMRHVGA